MDPWILTDDGFGWQSFPGEDVHLSVLGGGRKLGNSNLGKDFFGRQTGNWTHHFFLVHGG